MRVQWEDFFISAPVGGMFRFIYILEYNIIHSISRETPIEPAS